MTVHFCTASSEVRQPAGWLPYLDARGGYRSAIPPQPFDPLTPFV